MIDAYDPFFIIKIDGKDAPQNITDRIIKFEYEDTDDLDDILTLVLDNNDLSITDDPTLSEGGVINFRFGYLNRASSNKRAKIKDIEGFKEIKITAYQIIDIGSNNILPPSQDNKIVSIEEMVENKTYTVKKGDNLTKIAKLFNLKSWQDIYNIPDNRKIIGANPNLIFPGQTFVIPGNTVKSSVPSVKEEPNITSSFSNSNPNNVLAQRSRVFEKMTYSDVANVIAGEMALKIDMDDSKIKYDSIPQSNEDNISFLKRLAKEIGFQCYIGGDILYFRKFNYSTTAQRKLVYYIEGASEVEDFYPSIKTQKITSRVNSAATSPLDKSKESGSKSDTDSTKLGKFSYIIDGITGEEKRIAAPIKSASNDRLLNSDVLSEVDSAGASQMVESEQKWIEAKISCIGIPEITSGNLIEIQGVGKKWSGNWYMKTITHKIDSSGYYTSIESTRNALGQPAKISEPVSGDINNSKAPETGSKKEIPAVIVDGFTGKETRGFIE